ncbi:MAG: ParA family protein [Infirmifilum sp.]|jgi:chromosome partitioning protein|uniref:AAA domain-containing protein n=1 Tax=Infirmifilum uzonense TaxID=1550241 RepID=A0A0F7FH48_9CREN|nr:ParA family protein [Infirmifilum uzonense]AKG38448.1 hypothetical protein MA03_02990 [Infirmifilum uzonense]
MGRVVIFLSVKGGVGKTTLGVNTADMLARRVSGSDKVLLIDLDAQASATIYVLGYDSQRRYESEGRTVHSFLLKLWESAESLEPERYIVKASSTSSAWSDRLFIVPGDSRIMELERRFVAEGGAKGVAWLKLLMKAVEKFREKGFEYVFIDPPATLGVLSTMALAACDYFIIPIVPDDFGRASFKFFMTDYFSKASYDIVSQDLRPERPLCGGVVFNKLVSQSSAVHRRIADEIEKEVLSVKLYGKYPIPVYKTRLNEYIAYAKAVDEHKPIIAMPDKKAREQFEQFFNEFYDYVIKGRAGRESA